MEMSWHRGVPAVGPGVPLPAAEMHPMHGIVSIFIN